MRRTRLAGVRDGGPFGLKPKARLYYMNYTAGNDRAHAGGRVSHQVEKVAPLASQALATSATLSRNDES